MMNRFLWQRVWRDVTSAPFAIAAGFVCLILPAMILAGLYLEGTLEESSEDVLFVFGLGFVPIVLRLAWKIIQNALWRRRSVKALKQALAARGESAEAVDDDLFPDIPLWIAQGAIFCPEQNDLSMLHIDQLAWAYVEKRSARPGRQLVIWDRHAQGIVLPLHERDVDAALARLRGAAPWLPIGFNQAMKESWNADHWDFISLIDAHREAGKPFEAPWAGNGMAVVIGRARRQLFVDVRRFQEWEIAKENEDAAITVQLWNRARPG